MSSSEPVPILDGHSYDDEVKAVDMTVRLPEGVTIESVTVTQIRKTQNGRTATTADDLTVGTPSVNVAEYVYRTDPDDEDTEVTVAIGQAVLFRVAGGTDLTDYRLAVACTCSDESATGVNAVRTQALLFKVRD